MHFRRAFQTVACFICKTLNCCYFYTDRKFPPKPSSLGDVGGDDANKDAGKTDMDIEWVRAMNIAVPEQTAEQMKKGRVPYSFGFLRC